MIKLQFTLSSSVASSLYWVRALCMVLDPFPSKVWTAVKANLKFSLCLSLMSRLQIFFHDLQISVNSPNQDLTFSTFCKKWCVHPWANCAPNNMLWYVTKQANTARSNFSYSATNKCLTFEFMCKLKLCVYKRASEIWRIWRIWRFNQCSLL